MRSKGLTFTLSVVGVIRPPGMPAAPMLDLTSGYVQRALGQLHMQGPQQPWRLSQNYLVDWVQLRWRRIDDGALHSAAVPARGSTASGPADAAATAAGPTR